LSALVTENPADFLAVLPTEARLIGLDLGAKRIGIAICDAGRSVASPLSTLERKKFTADAEALKRICDEQGIGGVVVGLPLNMDGSTGPAAQAARAYGANLARALALPVLLWDERLSTVAVQRAMIDADVSRAKRAKRVDAAAAAYILQGALDRLTRLV
jgi:putative Holliday junction resolvase